MLRSLRACPDAFIRTQRQNAMMGSVLQREPSSRCCDLLYIVAGLGHRPARGPGWSAAGAWFREGKAGQTWPEEEVGGTPARTHPQLSPGQLSCGAPAALGPKKSLRPRPTLTTFQRTSEKSCARQDSGSPQTTLIPGRPSFPPPNFTHGTLWPRRREGLAQGQLPDLPTLRRLQQALELRGAWPSLRLPPPASSRD